MENQKTIKVYFKKFNEEKIEVINIDDVICCTKWFNYYGNATYGIYTKQGFKYYSLDPFEFYSFIYRESRYIPVIIVDHKREL